MTSATFDTLAARTDIARIETELARLEARMTIRLYTAIAALAAFTAALKLI